ncbi:hypothetical protein [Nostoc sp. ChiQUE01b]|nr:hypothetical protein [Nostoc sp. ChiQUE01b]MDZ8260253.1 hypothetical protein [Nostoc sp. ChiQUE01b]
MTFFGYFHQAQHLQLTIAQAGKPAHETGFLQVAWLYLMCEF